MPPRPTSPNSSYPGTCGRSAAGGTGVTALTSGAVRRPGSNSPTAASKRRNSPHRSRTSASSSGQPRHTSSGVFPASSSSSSSPGTRGSPAIGSPPQGCGGVAWRRHRPARGGRAEVGQPLRQQEPAEGRGVYDSAPAGSCPSPCSPWVILGGVFRSVSAGRGHDFGLDRPEQAIEAEGPVVTPLVDEERRGAVHAAANASHEVLSNPGGVDVFGQVPDEV